MTEHETSGDHHDAIAVGVPMFCRTIALNNLLESVPGYVETVYVADNGRDTDRSLYDRDWPFELEVLELEFDVGIGACRAAIVDACTEPYLWMGDNDMEFCRRSDLRRLREILEENPNLGGVAGWLIEGDNVRSGARNLQETSNGIAIKTANDPKIVYGQFPFTRFDFVPQAVLFRTAIFDDYSYDATIGSSEHFDLFWGHKQSKESYWDFASTPAVVTLHHRSINEEYRESRRGQDHVSLARIEEKWGIRDIVPGTHTDWAEVRDTGLLEDAFNLVKRTSPPRVWVPLKRIGEAILR